MPRRPRSMRHRAAPTAFELSASGHAGRACAMFIALTCLVVPGVASAGSNPAKLAKRISAAPDLRSAVKATREALAAGGVATVVNGKTVTRARRPAPIVASGTEVLNLAVEAQHKETAGRITLADLAAELRKAKFPFHRPRRAAKELKTFLRVWVRGARRNTGDRRTFTPLFLAAMAKRQSRPVSLAKGNYKPQMLRLTHLEVELFVAAFQRGPRRLWKGSRPARRSAVVAQGEYSPCTEFRKFQKEGLEQRFGKKVANDLDKMLDYGYQMLGDGATEPLKEVAEEGLAAGIEQVFLAYRGRIRPGQRARGISAKAAKRAMAALNVLLKVQKLAVMYGSLDLEVTPQFPLVHAPDRSKAPAGFTAIAGLDPDARRDYEAEKERLAGESDTAKAVRDCLKMVGITGLTTVGDVAEEMEKWRVKWHWSFLMSRAEHDFKRSKYNPTGTFRHYLTRTSPTEAGAAAFVYVKPDLPARDHTGCQDPIHRTPVTADVDLLTSQGAGLDTAINVATGDILGVLLEAATQMFQEAVTPSGSGTMFIEWHTRDSRFASAAQVCRGFPPSWTGTANGTVKYDGFTESWSAEFRLVRETEADGYAGYTAVSGKISWTLAGTNSSGCSRSGAGTFPVARGQGSGLGILDRESDPVYTLIIRRQIEQETVNMSGPVGCPHGQGSMTPLNTTSDFAYTEYPPGSAKYGGGTTLKGNRGYVPNDNDRNEVEWRWELTAGE